MEVFIATLLSINPFWFLIAIASGLLSGFIIRNTPLDRKTIYTLCIIWIPFIMVRFAILILYGATYASGAGNIGNILSSLYLLSIYIGRRVGRKLLR